MNLLVNLLGITSFFLVIVLHFLFTLLCGLKWLIQKLLKLAQSLTHLLRLAFTFSSHLAQILTVNLPFLQEHIKLRAKSQNCLAGFYQALCKLIDLLIKLFSTAQFPLHTGKRIIKHFIQITAYPCLEGFKHLLYQKKAFPSIKKLLF